MIPIAASAALSAAGSIADLLGTSSTSDTNGTTANGTAASKPAAGDQVTQADFMQLLIAQLQNQDPLNPLDSANFSAQLAQFSSLQQLTEINETLKKGAGGAAAPQLDAVGFLGKDVRGVSDTITVQHGSASTLDYTLAAAGTVEAKVLDGSGRTVADLILGTEGAGTHTLDLATVANAPHLADGSYTVRLYVGDGNGNAMPVDGLSGGVVTGVDLSGDAPVLLIGDQRLPLTAVREVKVPPAA